ncbi:MAG TPA: lytic transglycosylase domain-containing protein, partial [bacterium]|nr:lytic transglycosylase domain-containing protein [bacterium]
ESRFNPNAVSPKGATGLLQFMPGTAATVARQIGYTGNVNLYDPDLSIRLGAQHLKDLLDKYNGNIDAALAGYNAGTGNADSWISRGLLGNIPFRETNNYVKKVKNYQTVYSTMYATELGLRSPVELKQADEKENLSAVRGLIWTKLFENVISGF